jgi:cytochrome c-type biogenesis protein CcmH/NrfG
MRKEYLILIIFLAIISISGMAIYIYMNSHPAIAKTETQMPMGDSSMAAQMPPAGMGAEGTTPQGPDPQVLQKQIDQLESQLKAKPDDFDALVNLGNDYYDINNPAKAIENYEKALKLRPNEATVLVDCGSMYRQAGNVDKAIELFNRAIQIDPKLPQAYLNLGMATAMEKHNPAGAVMYWKKYLELDPNSEAKDFLTQEINKAEGK